MKALAHLVLVISCAATLLAQPDAAVRQRAAELRQKKTAPATGGAWEPVPESMLEFLHVVRAIPEGIICDVVTYNQRSGGQDHLRYLLLKHYPRESTAVAGDTLINVVARRVGRTDILGETSSIFDCAPPAPRVLTQQEAEAAHQAADVAQSNALARAAAKRQSGDAAVLKFHLERALAGDGTSQRRLAELYRARGDTNAAAAWLRAAATNTPPLNSRP